MVRSNFPGKPRSSHRKLISASSCASSPNEASLVAEKIYHGLSAFNAAFGDSEEMPTFHGFSPHQVSEAKKAAETSYKHVEKESEARGVIFVPFLPSKKFLKRYQPPDNEEKAGTNCKITLLDDKENADKLNRSTDSCDRILSAPVAGNLTASCKSNKKILRENVDSLDTFDDKLSNDSDPNSRNKLNKKFVLPCRSIHSSRVIKPNKRFLDLEVEDSETASVSSETGDCKYSQSSNFVPLKKPKLIFDENKGRDACWKIDSVSSSSSFTSTPSTSKSPLSKGILREAILNIELSPIKSDNFKSNRAKANTIVCGVCGAVRFYKFKKQMRKFGVISCESCRKFICKMINLLPTKNAASYCGGVLECHNQKGRIGYCDNPSILRNKEWNFKNVKLIHNQRCPACWLNTCIRKYNIPMDKRIGLSKMVPCEMRIAEFSEETALSCENNDAQQRKCDVKVVGWRKQQDKFANLRKKKHKNAMSSLTSMSRFISAVKNRDQVNETRQKKLEIENRIRMAKNLRKRTAAAHRSKRPDLTIQKRKSGQCSKVKGKNSFSSLESSAVEVSETRNKENVLLSPSNISNSDETLSSKQMDEVATDEIKNKTQKSIEFKDTSALVLPLARTLQDLGKQQEEETESQSISIDFWENYDPEEVCKTGFALIGSEPIHVYALCFLCGSAGVDKLIHCVSCCEAYHQYCVEMNMHPSKLSLDRNWWRVDWVCPKCTFCSVCSDPAPQLCCQRCQKSYHSNCLSPNRQRPQLTDRTWVCPSCLRCKSCNQTNVSKFIGNLPLCSPCFKLRQKGNFCPLCQRCYEDDDYDSKMMECGKCKSWVHAKCEGLSNEKYQVLSYLPESVEYICRVCCDIPPAPWWLAVEEELKTGYLNVLKCLSKNKKACDILKWSPKKRTADCICRNGLRVRTLRFSESQTSGMKMIRDGDNKCLNKDNPCDSKQNESVLNLSDCDANESDSFHLKKLSCNTLNISNLLRVNVENTDSQVGNYDGLATDKNVQFSPYATQSDSGIGSTDDELKATSSVDGESNSDDRSFANGQCFCSGLETWTKAAPTLLSIKKKVSSNEYSSLLQFHEDVESVINSIIESDDLTKVYHQTLEEVFPWFDPQGSQVLNTRSSCDLSLDDSLEMETINVIDGHKSVINETVECISSYEKDYYYLGMEKKDERVCVLCKGVSEGPMFEEGRLLYCGHNDWIHSNCALWSSEVFEEIDGSLQNVHSAISRGKMIRCTECSKKGATIGCCTRNCPETYHFLCAREANCTFLENKTIRCRLHPSDNDEGKILKSGADFHISRPVYVELERKKKKLMNYRNVKLAVGSLHVYNLGKFEPKVSDTSLAIIPVEFCCSRLFWSSIEPWKVIPYHIKTVLIDASCEYDCDSDLNFTIDHSVIIESPEEINLAVCEVLSFLCDSVSFREEEINEAQTNVNDLLSEQDTIFEDLPNEFFDGVFKDISSKMMSIEDLVAAGDKDDSSQSDSDGNNIIEMSEDDSQNCGSDNLSSKRSCFEFSLSNKSMKADLGLCMGSSKNIFLSKSAQCKDLPSEKGEDAILHVKIQENYNNLRNRSNVSNLLKEPDMNSLRLLQVDGLIDDSSCSDTCSSIDESESSWNEEDINYPEQKSVLKPNHCYDLCLDCEIPQLDGTIENPDSLKDEENPVKCSRCHRTYRTDVSYQRHLSSCSSEYMSSSGESDNEDDNKSNCAIDTSTETVGSGAGDSLHVSEINIVDDIIVTAPCNMNNLNVFVDQSNTVASENVECTESISLTVAPADEYETITHTAPGNEVVKQSVLMDSYCSAVSVDQAAYVPEESTLTGTVQYVNSVNGKGRPLKSCPDQRKSSESTTQSAQFSSPIIYQQPQQIIDQQQFNRTSISAPTFILQQMPQPSINISSFVQPVNPAPSIQYIAAVEPPSTPQYIATPDPMNPGTYRIQQSSAISSIVPQVVGAIIQPSVEQIVTVNPQAPSIDFYASQNRSNNIFLSSQPAVMGTVMNNPVICNSVMNNTLLNNSLVNNPVLNNAAVINNSVLNNTLISNQVVGSGYQTMATQLIQGSKPGVETTSYVLVNTEPNERDRTPVPSAMHSIQASPWTQPTNWSINKHTCKTTKEVTTMYHANAELLPDLSQPSQVNCVKVVKKKTTEEMMIETSSVNNSFYNKIPVKPVLKDNIQLNAGVSNLTKFVNDIPALFNVHFPHSSALSSSSAKPLTSNQNTVSTLVENIQMKYETALPNCLPVTKASSVNVDSNQPHLVNSKTNSGGSTPVLKPQVETSQSTDENSDYIECAISPPYSVSKVFSDQIKNFRTYSAKKVVPKLPVNNTRVSVACKTTPNNILAKVPRTHHCDNLTDSRILKPANKIENVEPKIMNGFNKNGNTVAKAKVNIKNGKKCNKPKVVFEINSGDGFSYSTTNLADAWQKIFEAVQLARAARKLPLLPQNPFKNAEASLRTLGLDNNGLKYLLEQLPGVGRCTKYKPTYHKVKPNPMRYEDLKENKSGCARSEPFLTRKEKYDMFSWLASRHRRPPKLLVATEADLINGNRRSSSINLPMAMRFRHLRETSKEAVGVFRSDIHGRGLFCLRDIDAGEMVIEYAGEVIRAALTDKREHFYNSKGIGCYMFRIDDFNVVDATLKGNAARFINHSCEPNCYSRIVDILGKKHILIFAQRRIPQGEELTYDYKFPLEEDKISCHCLSRKCRKYLN